MPLHPQVQLEDLVVAVEAVDGDIHVDLSRRELPATDVAAVEALRRPVAVGQVTDQALLGRARVEPVDAEVRSGGAGVGTVCQAM